MTLEEILVAVLALAVGAAFCFAGFKFFLILLPIWAFFIGLLAAPRRRRPCSATASCRTVTGWVVGVVVGIAFAILSYLFYWIAVILLGGTIGYAVGAGIMGAIGFDQGLILVLVALAVGALFAVGDGPPARTEVPRDHPLGLRRQRRDGRRGPAAARHHQAR